MEYIGGEGQTKIKLIIEENLNITQGSRFASVILFIKNNVNGLLLCMNKPTLELEGPNKQSNKSNAKKSSVPFLYRELLYSD